MTIIMAIRIMTIRIMTIRISIKEIFAKID